MYIFTKNKFLWLIEEGGMGRWGSLDLNKTCRPVPLKYLANITNPPQLLDLTPLQ